MSFGEAIQAGRVVLLVLPLFVSVFFGLRFVFYSEEGINLDRFCRRTVIRQRLKREDLASRERDRIYRRFTRMAGTMLLLFAVVYWIHSPVSELPFEELLRGD